MSYPLKPTAMLTGIAVVFLSTVNISQADTALPPPSSENSEQILIGARAKNFLNQTSKKTSLTQASSTGLVGDQQFYLTDIEFSGEGVDYQSQQRLHHLIQNDIQQQVTLSQLQAIADKISRYYRSQGYLAATAVIPPQQSQNGVIGIRIFLGKLEQISVANRSRLNDKMVERIIKRTATGNYLQREPVERLFERFNRLAGINVAGALQPGQQLGGTDLRLVLQDSQRIDALLYTDNQGGEASGRYRGGAQVSWNNPTGVGDKLFIGGLLTNHQMHNYNLGYERPFGAGETKLGVGLSRLDYDLGESFSVLDAVGVANTFNLYGNTQLITHRQTHLALTYGYTYRRLKDELRLFHYHEQKRSHSGSVGIEGDWQGENSRVTYQLGYSYGNVNNLTRPSAGEGHFHKLNMDASYRQQLGSAWQWYSKIQGQWANKALDGSEQFYLGGANGVRAYPQGEASGDSGYQASTELRYSPQFVSGLTVKTFLDWGGVKNRLDARYRHLAGWGVGMEYVATGSWLARLEYAHKLDGQESHSSEKNRSGQLWFQLIKRF